MDEDYPRTLLELERRFCTEEACVDYLAALRWPCGWACPRCAGADAWSIRRTRWLCGHCRYEMSVTAGTIFQDSHVPLTIWFRAMWQITSQKNGMSALGLQRVLGLGSYKTAWAMLHKLRRGHGSPRPRPVGWRCRGGRGLLGRRRNRRNRQRGRGKGSDYRRRRGGWKGHRAHPPAYDTGRVQHELARVHSRGDCAGKHGPVRRLERLFGIGRIRS